LAQECRSNSEQHYIHKVKTKTNEKHVLRHKDKWLLKSVTHIPHHIQAYKTTNKPHVKISITIKCIELYSVHSPTNALFIKLGKV